MKVSLHAIKRWGERGSQYVSWSEVTPDWMERARRRLLQIVMKGTQCWPKAKRIRKHRPTDTYFRQGDFVVVVSEDTILTVIPWRFDRWRKTPPK